MQSLRSVPELTDALKQYHTARPNLTSNFEQMLVMCRLMPQFQQIEDEPHNVADVLHQFSPPERAWGDHDPNQVITAAAGALYKQLDESGEPIEPYAFHSALQRTFPQFGERDQGHLMQQDADECFNSFLSAVGTQLQGDLVDNLFGIRQQITLTNAETDAEPPVIQYEQTLNLICHIEENEPCSTLAVGLINSTHGRVEKHSVLIGRSCVYNKNLRIANLPPYLVVKFERFQYNPFLPSIKKKILRQVSYPANLDVTPIATDELRFVIEKKRRQISEREDKKRQSLSSVAPADTAVPAPESEEFDEADALSSRTGMYELVGLVCHKVLMQHSLAYYCSLACDSGENGWLRALRRIWKNGGWPLD